MSDPPSLPATPLLGAEFAAMIDKGVSAIVASRDESLRPSLMRAVGSAIDPGTQRVTVYLSRAQSRQLVLDIAATGEVAVVFSEPLSHRTVQLKARGAQIRAATDDDAPVLARYLRSMEHEVGCVGFAPPFVRAMLAHEPRDLIAVSFSPEQAFDQTPGPRAGQALATP